MDKHFPDKFLGAIIYYMGYFGYGSGKSQLEINGEITTVLLYASSSYDRRRFFIPSIPLWGSVEYQDHRLRVSGSSGKKSVTLPDEPMSRDRSRVEFYENRIPDHAAALLLALEHEGPIVTAQQQQIREVLDPSLIVIPGL